MMFASLLLGPLRVGANLDGRVISLFPSCNPLQAKLSGLLHTHFLTTFSSMGMDYFPILLSLMNMV
jgi:hypothetical protein